MKNLLLLKIRGLASQEYTVETIAERCKISKAEAEYYVTEIRYRPRYNEPGKIGRYQTEHGITLPKPEMIDRSASEKGWKVTEKERERIRLLHSQGYTVTDIALKIGKHRDTVRNALKKMEVEDELTSSGRRR